MEGGTRILELGSCVRWGEICTLDSKGRNEDLHPRQVRSLSLCLSLSLSPSPSSTLSSGCRVLISILTSPIRKGSLAPDLQEGNIELSSGRGTDDHTIVNLSSLPALCPPSFCLMKCTPVPQPSLPCQPHILQHETMG
jgi:hypothetical protein